MKTEAILKLETQELNLAMARRRTMWIGFGAVAVVAVAAGLWFATHHTGTAKPASSAPIANVANMPAPASKLPSSPAGTNADVQVDLGPDDLKKAQLRTVHVGIDNAKTNLRVPGVVKPNEYREVHVTPLVGGVIKQVYVVLGDHVRRGQPLAVIFSSVLATAESEYLVVLAERDADHKKLVRTQNLVRLGAASQQEEEGVEAEHAGHEAHVRDALEKLKLYGASDRQIGALTQADQINAYLTVPAPISGIIFTRTANLGLVTNTGQELFTVADLAKVWVMASINEKDFSTIHVGTVATVTAPAYPGRIWEGRVAYIQPQVDPNTRTAQARIEVANQGESLRLDMYVDVAFTTIGGKSLVVPESAVQAVGEKQYVFVPMKDSEGSFTVRQVQLGPASNGYQPVLSGLKLNDEVVTDGSFTLKAETLRQHPDFVNAVP